MCPAIAAVRWWMAADAAWLLGFSAPVPPTPLLDTLWPSSSHLQLLPHACGHLLPRADEQELAAWHVQQL